MSASTTHTHNATNAADVPSAPPEALKRAGGWVQIDKTLLDRHCLSGEFLISRRALETLDDQGTTLSDVLAWFNRTPGLIARGETRRINTRFQAFFGFDSSKPNGQAFFVEIDLLPVAEEATTPASLTEIFGEPISVCTRAQLIADGELVDVTTTAAEAGFLTPVAISRAAWSDCVEWADADTARQTYQDAAGRLWDVLWMCSLGAKAAKTKDAFVFALYRVPRGGRGLRARLVKLKACIGPGDAGEPVVTIMLPSED